MTEKELIRLALESRLPDAMSHTPSEIIEAEARGAQAHIRRRRFALVGVTAALALVVGATVFGLRRLGETKVTPGAETSSASSKEEKDGSNVIKLCDFTGTKTGGNVDLLRQPENISDYSINIKDEELSITQKEGSITEGRYSESLIGPYSYNHIIKVFTADVSRDGKADICVETKPTYTSEESMVYMFDLENRLMQLYYVPGKLWSTLKEENDRLYLGLKSPGDKEYEYILAVMDGEISGFTDAKTEWLADLIKNVRTETTSISWEYFDTFNQSSRSYVGGKVYDNCSIYLSSMTPDAENGIDTDPLETVSEILGLIGGENAAYILQPDNSPVPMSDQMNYYGIYASVLESASKFETLGCHFGGSENKEIGSFAIIKDASDKLKISVMTTDDLGKDLHFGFKAPDDMTADDLSAPIKGKASGANVNHHYYCEDASALGITSPAQRMLISHNGTYAIGYHFDIADNGKTKFVVDSVQPENAEGKLTVTGLNGGSFKLEFDGKGSVKAGDSFDVDIGLSDADIHNRTQSGSTINEVNALLSVEFDGYKDGVRPYFINDAVDTYTFGEKVYEKEFVNLADFADRKTVTRLADGSQIRFDKQLSSFPGTAVVSMTDTSVTVNVGGTEHKVAEDMKITHVCASDLNDDGKQEVIVECCKSDPRTDGTVKIYDLISGRLLSLDESYFKDDGIYLDKAGVSLSIYRYMEPEQTPQQGEQSEAPVPQQGTSLKSVFAAGDSTGFANYVYEVIDAVERASAEDKNNVRYQFSSESVDVLFGRFYEAPEITEIIRKALKEETYTIKAVDRDHDRDIYFVSTMFIDDERSGSGRFELVYQKTGEEYGYWFYPCENNTGYLGEDLTVTMKLPESANEILGYIMDPETPHFNNIEQDGADAGVRYKDGEFEKIDHDSSEITDLENIVKIKTRLTFDWPNCITDIDSIETAEGVSVEMITIKYEVYSGVSGIGKANSFVSREELRSGGSITKTVDLSKNVSSDFHPYIVRVGFELQLKLPDGTDRMVYRGIGYNLVPDGDVETE